MFSLNPPIRDWHDKTVWIVGGSTGIGLSLARLLITKGATVIVSARRQEALEQITPKPAMVIACDVADAESIDRAIRLQHESGRIPDVVFWMAGVYAPMPSHDLDLAQVRNTFEINTISAYQGQAALVRLWQSVPQKTRHWILISSVAGYSGLPQAAAYGASKAAMTYLAETSHVELRGRGIAVSVVNPGFVETRLTQKNNFKMPAIISADAAAKATLDGLAQGRFEIHYPKRFTYWLKLLRVLPYALTLRIMRFAVPNSDRRDGH
jgi:NAD(P)-dependent dehydrogenase (short-subunit alcohol dehydrogenase family)